MPYLSAKIRDPRERPTGDQGDHQIESHQRPRERATLPATREDNERYCTCNPGSHKPENSGLLVTLKEWLSRSKCSFDRFFRPFSSQVGGACREAGKHEDAQRDLLYRSTPPEQSKPEQKSPKCDAQDWQMGRDQVEMGSVHGSPIRWLPAA